MALLVQRCVSNAASFCSMRVSSCQHNLLGELTPLQNTCVRQVVLDKWFPLIDAVLVQMYVIIVQQYKMLCYIIVDYITH